MFVFKFCVLLCFILTYKTRDPDDPGLVINFNLMKCKGPVKWWIGVVSCTVRFDNYRILIFVVKNQVQWILLRIPQDEIFSGSILYICAYWSHMSASRKTLVLRNRYLYYRWLMTQLDKSRLKTNVTAWTRCHIGWLFVDLCYMWWYKVVMIHWCI